MIKGYYSNAELATIVGRCTSIDELKKAGCCLLELHADYEIVDIKFFDLMSHKRIRRIIN